jgi:DNA-directed RNA polymerase specialized sigma24 family protein
LFTNAHGETEGVSKIITNTMNINIFDFQKDIVAKAKSNRIKGMDWEDIAQELYVHLLQSGGKYDPSRGASERTFVIRVITNKIRDLARAANAQKRYLDNNSLSLEELGELEDKNIEGAI